MRRLRLRVLGGRRVPLIGDNAIPVVQGQSPGVAAGNVRHRRAGVAGGNTEDRARVVQRPHDGADAVPVSRRHEFGRLPAGEPAHRYRHSGRDDGIDVDHRVELDLRAGFDAGAIEHHRTRADPGAALDYASGEVSVRADQRVVTDAGFLARYTPDDCV